MTIPHDCHHKSVTAMGDFFSRYCKRVLNICHGTPAPPVSCTITSTATNPAHGNRRSDVTTPPLREKETTHIAAHSGDNDIEQECLIALQPVRWEESHILMSGATSAAFEIKG